MSKKRSDGLLARVPSGFKPPAHYWNMPEADGVLANIRVSYWAKPIPDRRFDYTAVGDDYDGAPDAGFQPVGHGATREDAIKDYLAQIAERDDQ